MFTVRPRPASFLAAQAPPGMFKAICGDPDAIPMPSGLLFEPVSEDLIGFSLSKLRSCEDLLPCCPMLHTGERPGLQEGGK